MDVLIADRLSNSVYRYSETGALIGTVVSDSANLNQATGLALSPDLKHLYVSSFQDARVVRYEYDYASGTATSGVIFADQSDGLLSPSAILFSEDGDTIYVSNLGGTGVARFKSDGTIAGPPILFAAPFGATQFQFSGLTLTPAGDLLIGAFQDFPAGVNGAVGVYRHPNSEMEIFIDSAPTLSGASGLMVHDGFLYVTGMFASNIQRFSIADGSADASFSISNLAFPQALMLSPDGNGFIVGILGFANGQGQIAHYDFEGGLIGDGVFASPGGGGFTEATAFVAVPDPSPGDFNLDWKVNAADLAVWRQNFGHASDNSAIESGDADGNNLVDGADFLIWQRNFSGSSGAVAQPVPEPCSSALCLAGLTLVLRPRPRKTREV